MSNYQPKNGDRIRVALEGRASVETQGFDLILDNGTSRYFSNHDSGTLYDANTKVTKIEPPVVTFKPGDVVKSKKTGYIYTLAEGRYFDHTNASWTHGRGGNFTSACYELA